MANIFISYSSDDKPFAIQLRKILSALGHDPWIDDYEIKVGDTIVSSLGKAAARADYFLVVLTQKSVRSSWVESELNMQFFRDKIQILPVLKERCDIPPFLRDKSYADFSEDFTKGLIRLLKAITPPHSNIYRDHSMAQPTLIDLIRTSDSGTISDAYFFQYSAVEIRPVLRQAVLSGFNSLVYVQDPDRSPTRRQHQRIEVSLDAISQIDNTSGKVKVYKLNLPVTAKIIFLPNTFVALSYYIYLDSLSAPTPLTDTGLEQDMAMEARQLGQYDVSGHDNPVIIVRNGDMGWKYWSDFAQQLHTRYMQCSTLIHPKQQFTSR